MLEKAYKLLADEGVSQVARGFGLHQQGNGFVVEMHGGSVFQIQISEID